MNSARLLHCSHGRGRNIPVSRYTKYRLGLGQALTDLAPRLGVRIRTDRVHRVAVTEKYCREGLSHGFKRPYFVRATHALMRCSSTSSGSAPAPSTSS